MNTKRVMVAVVLAAAASAAACNKSLEDQQAEAAKAAAKAEEKTREANQAVQNAAEERQEYLAAIARERKNYIHKLDREVRAIDQHMLEIDPVLGTEERDRLGERRELLRSDLDLIQSSTEANWAAVKAKIDNDLAGPGKI